MDNEEHPFDAALEHRIHIRDLQTDPGFIIMARDKFRAQSGGSPMRCTWCREGGEGVKLMRCLQCADGMPGCASCAMIAHERYPLHWVEEWSGTFWKRTSLFVLGYTFQHGHDGLPCPNPAPDTEGPGLVHHHLLMPRRTDVYVDDDYADDEPLLVDKGYHVSTDGARTVSNLLNVRPQKRTRVEPGQLEDSYAGWTPMPEDDLDEVQAVADTVSSLDIGGDDGLEDGDAAKRKRYKSSDEPMTLWHPLDQYFLDALLRREGLGGYVFDPVCTSCRVPYGDGVRFFRCDQCGEFLQCQNCIKSRHELNPLHGIKEWDGEKWTEATLCGQAPARPDGLGLVYQLGHHGFTCEFPGRVRQMVVMDITGIHTIDCQECTCKEGERKSNLDFLLENAWYPATTVDPEMCATFRTLEQFRLLNVVGNVTVHDYVGTLEWMTDTLRLSSVPDRYKVFGRMSRQWLEDDETGGLAVLCWACPHDGKNLPDGWRDVDARYRFLYMLLLALDANFRLKNCLRANEHQDPSLGGGKEYFVESEAYKTHLRNYVAEKDVSSCIAFAALLQKETRLTTGLRVSGVGGCVCARHGVVRPLGLGDLQKGERYANMDYILLSALAGVAILLLAISYDIACQWKVHLPERAKKIAETTPITTRLDDFEIQYALPVWHAVAHEITCQTQNSLSFAVGVGRTDGEGIERTWAVLNPIGFATKEMGDGARHDAIKNKVDHLNWEKNLGQGNMLARKIIVAIAERDKQVAAFKEVDGSLHKSLRRDWKARITAWIEDREKPNPYCLEGGKSGGPSEAAVLLELKTAESVETAEGRTPLSDSKSTASAFVKAGLQLEEAQRRIKAEVKGVTLVTADCASQIQELRIAFLKKLRTYERLQTIYAPGVAALREVAEDARDPDLPPPRAEDIKLWMGSELTAAQRRSACRKGVVEAEAKLRKAQCDDSLDNLRSRLHAQRHLITWRNSNAVGQRGTTRSAMLIGRVGDRIARVAGKYRRAREALITLKGAAFAPQFRDLKQEDMNVNPEEESDAAARKKLGRLGSSRRARNEPSNTKKTFSWIWTVGGGPGGNDTQLHDSVRVEWSKAKARRDRWVEEVGKLREEMKCVLRMLRTIQREWLERATHQVGIDPVLKAGLKAYALRQVAVHRRIGEGFHSGWNRSVATAVRDVMRQDGTIYRGTLDGQEMDTAPTVGLLELEEAEEAEGSSLRRSGRNTAGAGA
ncbi:hypothetical protein C8R44DRAFT_887052 [Mycena epipterygia]|nr:hypothetical protein C8R44DRAFT_887052 [Mycena epipterygia]